MQASYVVSEILVKYVKSYSNENIYKYDWQLDMLHFLTRKATYSIILSRFAFGRGLQELSSNNEQNSQIKAAILMVFYSDCRE
jgi:hypothetical protein